MYSRGMKSLCKGYLFSLVLCGIVCYCQAVELTPVSVAINVTGSGYTWDTSLGLSGTVYVDEVNQAGRKLTSCILNVGSAVTWAGIRDRIKRRK